MERERNQRTGDELRALQLAKDVGFRVQDDGYILPTQLMDRLDDMIVRFFEKAQADLLTDDGK